MGIRLIRLSANCTTVTDPAAAAEVMVRYNPHPPVAILLTIPMATARFEVAVQLIVWTQLVALALTWVLCFELVVARILGWAWAAAGSAFGFWAPVWQGLAWGQPIGFLALTTLGIWWLARSERAVGFGILLATTILVRPFVATLVVLASGWTIRQQCRATIGLLMGGLIPLWRTSDGSWDRYRVAGMPAATYRCVDPFLAFSRLVRLVE